MITGVVNANREAIIRLVIAGPGGQQHDTEAIIDTGFTGFLTRILSFCFAVKSVRARTRDTVWGNSEIVCIPVALSTSQQKK